MDKLPRNVLGGPLRICCMEPATGFYRNGMCEVGDDDVGCHAVCAQMTEEFLQYNLDEGNDLITAVPAMGFFGLKPGDRWCLCALRWKQAYDAGVAPPIILSATHEAVLQYVPLDVLSQFAMDRDLTGYSGAL